MSEKFELIIADEYMSIRDVETGRQLNMNDKYHVKQLVDLLNLWHDIITDKWGLK